ncbi:MAG: hydroxymyristoyl-ACP dehydratase [Methylotetracoccus sp.]
MMHARDPGLDLLPHKGAMCLLDRVISWDRRHIRCTAVSHRAIDNPLRERGRVDGICLIEYAAQAVALHGGLIGNGAAAPGYLAAVRDVRLAVRALERIDAELVIEAECELADPSGLLYRFAIEAAGAKLGSGRLSISLARRTVAA